MKTFLIVVLIAFVASFIIRRISSYFIGKQNERGLLILKRIWDEGEIGVEPNDANDAMMEKFYETLFNDGVLVTIQDIMEENLDILDYYSLCVLHKEVFIRREVEIGYGKKLYILLNGLK